jgi:hypothetical protein
MRRHTVLAGTSAAFGEPWSAMGGRGASGHGSAPWLSMWTEFRPDFETMHHGMRNRPHSPLACIGSLTISNGKDRGIVVNELGLNENVWIYGRRRQSSPHQRRQ